MIHSGSKGRQREKKHWIIQEAGGNFGKIPVNSREQITKQWMYDISRITMLHSHEMANTYRYSSSGARNKWYYMHTYVSSLYWTRGIIRAHDGIISGVTYTHTLDYHYQGHEAAPIKDSHIHGRGSTQLMRPTSGVIILERASSLCGH